MTDNTIVGVTHQIDAELADNVRRIEALTVTIGQLRGEIDRIKAEDQTKLDAQAADWKKLNELLNEYATDETMCDGYEDKLETWNETFTSGLRLHGRYKSHVVTLKVTLTYEHEVEVDAISHDDAKDKVGDWDVSDIIENFDYQDWNDYDYNVISAREGYL